MNKIELLAEYIKNSNNIVFFGGAGVSTESGIPDFRSKDGLYNIHDVNFENYTPEYLLSHDCLVDNPKVFYEFYRQKMDSRNISPNYAHKFLTKLEKEGKLKSIITQNIDGLHQKAGSNNVYEIHGSILNNYCISCNKYYPKDYIFDNSELIPHCDCGGIVRCDVVLYGEMLPEYSVAKSIEYIRKAEMLIIGGTSLKVYPAASYVNEFCGKYLVVINREHINVNIYNTEFLEINDSIGKVFEKISRLI